jgi:Na+/proline symporter
MGKDLSVRASLVGGRVLTGGFIILAALVAPLASYNDMGLYNFIQMLLSLFQGPTLALLLLGILWKRTTGKAAAAGLIIGVGFCVMLNFAEGVFPSEWPFLFVAWWSFVLTLIICVVGSLLTKPEPEEKIAGLTWGSVVSQEAVQEALRRRAES